MKDRTELFRLNKSSFDEIIGDPYGWPESVIGQYTILNTRSSIRTTAGDLGLGQGTSNPASPSISDFCCDVEKSIHLGLIRHARGDKKKAASLLTVFLNTYIIEDESRETFDSKERRDIEQIIGRLFLQRKISPAKKYFTTQRKRVK